MARKNAEAMLREFAGETVTAIADMQKAERLEQFERAAAEYADASSFSQKIQSVSEKMNISGISVLHRWQQVHPLSGRTVCGVVVSWSPKQAYLALEMKRKMEAPAAAPAAVRRAQPAAAAGTTGAGTSANPAASAAQPAPKPTANTYRARGKSADFNAF